MFQLHPLSYTVTGIAPTEYRQDLTVHQITTNEFVLHDLSRGQHFNFSTKTWIDLNCNYAENQDVCAFFGTMSELCEFLDANYQSVVRK